MQIVYHMALITINETIIVQLISFLIFLFIINRIMFRPLGRTMDERVTYVQTLQAEIEQSESELQKISDQISTRESAARAEAFDLSKEMQASGTLEAGEAFDLAKEKVSIRVKETKKAMDDQIAEAIKSIKAESEVLADRILEKLLDRELS